MPSADATPLADVARRVRAAVEAVASVDPNPNDPYRGLYVSDDLARALATEASGDPEAEDRLARAASLLGLDELDRRILAACAAPHLSAPYARLYGYLHDDLTRRLPSPRLVARLLADDATPPAAVLARLGDDAPLRTCGAVLPADVGSELPLPDRGLAVAPSLAAFLVGATVGGEADGLVRIAPPTIPLGRERATTELARLLAAEPALPVVVAGPDAEGVLASAAGRTVAALPLIAAGEPHRLRAARLATLLAGELLVLEDAGEGLPPDLRPAAVAALRAARGIVICAPDRGVLIDLGELTLLVVELDGPSRAEREHAWSALLPGADVGDVAAKFRLPVARIGDAAVSAELAARMRGDAAPTPADLDLGARLASSGRLAELADRVEPRAGWDDLVLAPQRLELVRSISSYLRHRDQVLGEWGFDRSVAKDQGLKALFAGESGTGKTLAAQVLARDLGLDLYRIDLATVVSKYIGETEKNLDAIFDAAEGSNAILFFDEADALFGKRSDVKDAHDRYANLEVAYLLQRMETYPGAVVLATNFRQNIDEAFLRRLDVLVDFPFPETEDRERIWQLHLPAQAPVAADVDVSFLAERFRLSGGNIRNAAIAAAFLAAAEGTPIGMRHLVRGVALEYGKLGRLTIEAEFEQYHGLVRGVMP